MSKNTRTEDKKTCRNARFGQEYGVDVAKLDVHSPRTRDGRKVMTWDYSPLGSKKTYPIEVAYHLDDEGRMYFSATNAELGLALENSDVEVLRRQVETELLLVSADIQSMKWEDWLQVSVSGSGSCFNDNRYTGMGAELKIHVQRLKRGWHEATQREVTVGSSGFLTEFPKPTECSARETSRASDLDWLTGASRPQTAYIRDTPQNRAALNDIQARLGALQDRLMALLHQDAIDVSLEGLEGLLLPSNIATDQPGS